MSIDKVDAVEFLADYLDEKEIEGLGRVLAAATDDMFDGKMLLSTWPDGDDKPSVDFLVRITRARKAPTS